ncbi:hypothetical protein EVAR_57966_1 [Eumeta japonica]|uniref:Uncharacterized protein n=1 Tax=Eumeta variegata TaxID=151549 RepID=A0A4C1XZK1_EUMVA|nr:hypothetical protein EVAR_57966_1 [Eumeta japonica]
MIRNLNRSPCNGRKRRKAAEEIQGSKVGIEAYGDNFGIVKAREQSYRSDVEVIARSAFYKTMHLSTRAGFEAGPEGHGLRKLTTHPTAQI